MNKQTPLSKINYSGNLDQLLGRICASYGIGELKDFFIIEVGYEDCNIMIDTEKGKFLSKIFKKERSLEDIHRYVTIMEKTLEAGVNHPRLFYTANGEATYTDKVVNNINLVLMEFIEGKTFFELNRAPNSKERQEIISQAVKVNSINHHPPDLFDSWAIPNVCSMFERTKQFIESKDLKLVQKAIAKYELIPVTKLPHCFVHGDFIKTNVMKTADAVYILDFSVANWYPRIQELAVILANLLHEGRTDMLLEEKSEIVAGEYSRLSPLTLEERQYLPDYALAGIAMQFMGSHQEKYINGNDTRETDYWLNLGREGLRRELMNDKNT